MSSGVALNTLVESNVVTMTGMSEPAAISGKHLPLKCGYADGYGIQIGYSTMSSLTIASGSLVVENVAVR